MTEPKTCPGAHFKYFAHCERCKWSEAIMLDVIADPWPRCEVCHDAMAVFAIGCPVPIRPDAMGDHAAAEFSTRRAERFLGQGPTMKKVKAKRATKIRTVVRGVVKKAIASGKRDARAKAKAKAKPVKRAAGGKPVKSKLDFSNVPGLMPNFHPIANAFPLIYGDDFKQFCEHAKARGYIASHPIIMFEGKILDGRNRWRMCQVTGLKPTIREFDPATEGDPIQFVISENIDRRNLTPSQKAMAAANLEKLQRGRPKTGSARGMSRDEAADRMGVSRRSVARGAVVRDQGSVALQNAVKAGTVPVKVAAEIAANLTPIEQAIVVKGGEKAVLSAAKKIRAEQADKRRAERTAKIITNSDCTAESLLIGGRRHPILFADPPVRYVMGDTDRSVENHYPTMTLDELCALGPAIQKLAADDAVLFVTLPDTHLFVTGVPLLAAWGFEHKSGAVWDKLKRGMGKYFGMQHEHMLVCTRGNGLPEPKDKVSSVIQAPRGKHSEKPQKLFDVIEQMYPQFFRKEGDPLAIELFARTARKGWACWGNQAPQAESAKAA